MADTEDKLVAVKDLKAGDMVDMKKSTLPFPYTDPLAGFEYAIVEEVAPDNNPALLLVAFENMTNVALAADDKLYVVHND